jgi:hypothetical protein
MATLVAYFITLRAESRKYAGLVRLFFVAATRLLQVKASPEPSASIADLESVCPRELENRRPRENEEMRTKEIRSRCDHLRR